TATFFLLDKATNPSNRQKEWDYITRFCNQINKELEGITVSPKYLGDRLSEQVKTKVIELLYTCLVRTLPHSFSGIVAEDPVIPVDKTLIPSPKHTNPVFDNEEKTKNFLKVKIIEVLQEAKRIIKNMDVAVQQEVSHRVSILEEVNNSVTLLNEMRSHFKRDESTQEGKELLNVRHLIFRCGLDVVTATDDDDSALGDILHASDDLSRVINSYKRIVGGQTIMIDLPGSTASECMYCIMYQNYNYISYPDKLLACLASYCVLLLLSFRKKCPLTAAVPKLPLYFIVLLDNPLKEKVRMRYKLTFILGDRQVTESEEIDKFPPVERWGYL
uniref:Golgi associated, gamma adaptin ear containing, ARF binding protein 3a n=1 Tax=Cyprinus carpio carpio TaxID=630221 RepID=A0A9J7Y4D4_CYPCA